MSWGRVCDTLYSHPKVLDADLEAMGLWVLALSYAGAQLTDGHIKRSAAVRLAGDAKRSDRLAARLVSVGLWEPHPSGDGWQMHDYLAFNPSREQVLRERDSKSAAGKATAAKRWGTKPSSSSSGSSYRTSDSSSNSSPHDAATTHGDAPVPSRPIPDPNPEKRESELTLVPTEPGGVKARNGKPAKSFVPTSVATSAAVDAWCLANGVPLPSEKREVAKMLDHFRAKGEARSDWAATWRNWERRAPEFASNGSRRAPWDDGIQKAPPEPEWRKHAHAPAPIGGGDDGLDEAPLPNPGSTEVRA